MERIVTIFEQLTGPLPDWPELKPHIKLMHLKRGGSLFAAAQPMPHIFIVLNGLIKLHHDNAEGRERIKNFAAEGAIVASISALQTNGRASFSATALEPASLARIPYKALEHMADTHFAWGRLLRTVLMGYALQKEQREQGFLMQSAAVRYEALIRAQPNLAARVAQKDLAAYLGVTPVGLSRIATRARANQTPA